jgi:hypothetical protein
LGELEIKTFPKKNFGNISDSEKEGGKFRGAFIDNGLFFREPAGLGVRDDGLMRCVVAVRADMLGRRLEPAHVRE